MQEKRVNTVESTRRVPNVAVPRRAERPRLATSARRRRNLSRALEVGSGFVHRLVECRRRKCRVERRSRFKSRAAAAWALSLFQRSHQIEMTRTKKVKALLCLHLFCFSFLRLKLPSTFQVVYPSPVTKLRAAQWHGGRVRRQCVRPSPLPSTQPPGSTVSPPQKVEEGEDENEGVYSTDEADGGRRRRRRRRRPHRVRRLWVYPVPKTFKP